MALFQRNVMPRITSSTDVRLRTVQVARRFNVVSRTIERWEQDPELNFPKPLVVNGRKYWRREEVEHWERALDADGPKASSRPEHQNCEDSWGYLAARGYRNKERRRRWQITFSKIPASI